MPCRKSIFVFCSIVDKTYFFLSYQSSLLAKAPVYPLQIQHLLSIHPFFKLLLGRDNIKV